MGEQQVQGILWLIPFVTMSAWFYYSVLFKASGYTESKKGCVLAVLFTLIYLGVPIAYSLLFLEYSVIKVIGIYATIIGVYALVTIIISPGIYGIERETWVKRCILQANSFLFLVAIYVITGYMSNALIWFVGAAIIFTAGVVNTIHEFCFRPAIVAIRHSDSIPSEYAHSIPEPTTETPMYTTHEELPMFLLPLICIGIFPFSIGALDLVLVREVYMTIIHVAAALLGIVGMFSIFILSHAKVQWSRVLGRVIKGFVVLYILIIVLGLINMLLSKDSGFIYPIDLSHDVIIPLEIGASVQLPNIEQSLSTLAFVALIYLAIGALAYLYALVSFLIDVQSPDS